MFRFETTLGSPGTPETCSQVGTGVKIIKAQGKLSFTTDTKRTFDGYAGFSNDHLGKFNNLKVISDFSGDDIILDIAEPGEEFGGGDGSKPGSALPAIQYFDQNSSTLKTVQGDDENIFARPAIQVGGGSFTPGGLITQLSLNGEEWIAVSIDHATYTSGVGLPLQLFTQSDFQSITPEMIDMQTGLVVDRIARPDTWYKVKVQGGTFLNIPAGTLTGNGPGNSINFSIVRGYTPYERQEKDTLIIGPLIFNSNASQKFLVAKPAGAAGAVFWLDGAFDPGQAFAASMTPINPLTHQAFTGGAFGLGLGPAPGGPNQRSFTPSGASVSGGHFFTQLNELDLNDANATPGTPDTNVTVVIEWVYQS